MRRIDPTRHYLIQQLFYCHSSYMAHHDVLNFVFIYISDVYHHVVTHDYIGFILVSKEIEPHDLRPYLDI